MKRISVIGFGKIGQAVAANILHHGHRVTAIDTNTSLHELFKSGEFTTAEPGLGEILLPAYQNNQLTITGQYTAVAESDAIIVAIPLLIDQQRKIDDGPFLQAMKMVAAACANNVVIVIETSVPVGFCRNAVVASMEQEGKKHGKDFLLAYSPERIKSGTMLEQLARIPKIIGGIDTAATDKAYEIYRLFFAGQQLHRAGSIEAAEMLKLAGMIYRDVNIALSNQLAQFANSKGIDLVSLIPLINTDREANLLQPGIGVGGHCTPVYPYFLIENFRQAGIDFTLASQSRMINNQMAAYAVSLVKDKVNKKKALLLGLGFRPNVKEDAQSTTYILNEVLLHSGFEVVVHDAEYSAAEISQKGLKPALDIYTPGSEVVFLVTMHRQYYDLDFDRLAANGAKFFIDGRNLVDRERVKKAGIEYLGIGR